MFRGGCGAGGRGRQVEQQTGFDKLATQHGFVAVYPEGSALPGGPGVRTRNAGHCCGLARARDGQDMSGIDATPILWAFLFPYALAG